MPARVTSRQGNTEAGDALIQDSRVASLWNAPPLGPIVLHPKSARPATPDPLEPGTLHCNEEASEEAKLGAATKPGGFDDRRGPVGTARIDKDPLGCIAPKDPHGCIAKDPQGCIAKDPQGCIATKDPPGCIAREPPGCIATEPPGCRSTACNAASMPLGPSGDWASTFGNLWGRVPVEGGGSYKMSTNGDRPWPARGPINQELIERERPRLEIGRCISRLSGAVLRRRRCTSRHDPRDRVGPPTSAPRPEAAPEKTDDRPDAS